MNFSQFQIGYCRDSGRRAEQF